MPATTISDNQGHSLQLGSNTSVPVSVVGSLAKGVQTLSVPTTAGGVSLTIPSGAAKAFITNESNQVRYWVNGTAPTATTGHLVNINDVINLDSSEQLANFKAIAVSGTATLQITYF